MAITSPDNIRTPDPGDPYNLVPDLQTLAQDVQDALIARGNVFRGTAAQRAAFLSTASPGMLWQDTDGIGMLWKRGASQWVPAVWRWGGTTTQMNSFTQAPDGFTWFNTTDSSEYVRLGGAWAGSGWKTVSLTGGWTTPASFQMSFSSGVVYSRGRLLNLPFTGGYTTIGSLPTGIPAPQSDVIVRLGANSGALCTARVTPSGNIQIWRDVSSGAHWGVEPITYRP